MEPIEQRIRPLVEGPKSSPAFMMGLPAGRLHGMCLPIFARGVSRRISCPTGKRPFCKPMPFVKCHQADVQKRAVCTIPVSA